MAGGRLLLPVPRVHRQEGPPSRALVGFTQDAPRRAVAATGCVQSAVLLQRHRSEAAAAWPWMMRTHPRLVQLQFAAPAAPIVYDSSLVKFNRVPNNKRQKKGFILKRISPRL